MRILYVTAELPYSTQEAFIIPEITELIGRGFEVLVVPRSPRASVVHADAASLLENTAREPLISMPILLAALAELCRRPIRALKAIGSVLHSRSPMILMRNLAVIPKGLWLARLARDWRADHIHAHWATTTSTMALIASEVSGIPWSFTAHRGDIVVDNMLALKVRRASLARFISRSGLDLARLARVEGLDQKARVVHMGIPIPPRQTTNARQNASRIVICAGNLLPVKGHKYLIEAVSILKERGVDMCLKLAGEGEMRIALQQQVKDLQLEDRVQLMGQLSHTKLLELYENGCVAAVVHPSVDLGSGVHEGIPVALIEAMGYGIPTVSTRTGGIPELLDDGAGLLVPPQDSGALADALAGLLRDPERGSQMALSGRRRVEEQFSIEAVMSELAAHFALHRSSPETP